MQLRKIAASCVASLALAVAFAAPAPRKTLTQANLDVFVSSLGNIMEDLDSLDLEGESGMMAAIDNAFQGETFDSATMLDGFGELKKYDLLNTILRRNGWDPSFWDVYVAVLGCYFVSMVDTMIAQGPEYADMAKNPSYVEFRAIVHKDDLELVRANFEKVGMAFEAVNEE